MLPFNVGVQLVDALEDRVITPSELTNAANSTYQSVMSTLVLAFTVMMFAKGLDVGSSKKKAEKIAEEAGYAINV